MNLRTTSIKTLGAAIFSILITFYSHAQEDIEKRKKFLEEILQLQRPHPSENERPRNVYSSFVRLSHWDATWLDWLERTGELPPDFDALPSIPFLPDPLIMDEGRSNMPVKTMDDWATKRTWIQNQVIHLFSGSFPPAPETIEIRIIDQKLDGDVKVELVELYFGKEDKAKMTIEVFTPPGNGPFPVFLTQWNHRGWAQIAVRRGYMGMVYAGADDKDDSIHYQELFPEYDWTTLMTRAWGAHRAVDYIYYLANTNKSQIALTGHSRNAKLSLFAAAFDPRITAVISSSGGTGGEIPYRYTDERHKNESIDFLTSIRPQWLHPRLRFYAEREHKLPIDQNSLMALIAPNSLLLSSSIREDGGGDPWANEQNFLSLQKVYDFLEAPEKLGIRFRDGDHSVSARDIESFLDWLDIQFDRKDLPWDNKLYYPYNFEKWKEISAESNFQAEHQFLEILIDGKGKAISDTSAWETKKGQLRENLEGLLGEKPPGVAANPIIELTNKQDYQSLLINRPKVLNGRKMNISPYNALGDYQYAAFYYPTDENAEMKTAKNEKIPVILFLNNYSNIGYNSNLNALFDDFLSKGIAVLTMDLLGYGERIEEGTLFYERYPRWSKMGKMVTDTRAAIDALLDLDFVDPEKIFIGGHSLGGSVALLTAALDNRIKGTALAAAFTPWRDQESQKHLEGVKLFSHLYGLIPRLGFYVGRENEIPIDFGEILAMTAPGSILVISPSLDRHANLKTVEKTVEEAKQVFGLFHSEEKITLSSPYMYNRFTREIQLEMAEWIETLAR